METFKINEHSNTICKIKECWVSKSYIKQCACTDCFLMPWAVKRQEKALNGPRNGVSLCKWKIEIQFELLKQRKI